MADVEATKCDVCGAFSIGEECCGKVKPFTTVHVDAFNAALYRDGHPAFVGVEYEPTDEGRSLAARDRERLAGGRDRRPGLASADAGDVLGRDTTRRLRLGK